MCTTESPFFFFFFVIKNVNISRFLLISGSLSSCTQACADKGKEGCTQWDLFRWVQLLCEEEVTGVMALGWKLCVSALPTSCSRYHCAPLASEKETSSRLCAGMVEEFSLCSHIERIQAWGCGTTVPHTQWITENIDPRQGKQVNLVVIEGWQLCSMSSSLPPYHTKTLGWAQLSMGAISQTLSFCSKLTLLEKGCCQS